MLIILLGWTSPTDFGIGRQTRKDFLMHLFYRWDPFAPHLSTQSKDFMMVLFIQSFGDGIKIIRFLQRKSFIGIVQIGVPVIGIYHIVSFGNSFVYQLQITFPKVDYG